MNTVALRPIHSSFSSVDDHDPDERLHDRFMRQAVLTPAAIAVIHSGRHVTYRDLDERSGRIADLLRSKRVGPGALVGICLDRSVDLVAAIIGTLKAGAAYVPLDPAYPRDRLNFMLADSAADTLITTHGGFIFHGTVIDPGSDAAPLALGAPALLELRDEAALACVFYTSGSTGRPKGVMLRHTATGFVRWAGQTFADGELARVAATTSICFDPSMFEIFAPLSVGGTVILKRDLLEPFAADERPTLLNGVPSAYAELVRQNRIPDSVRVVNIGGERLSASLARAIHRQVAGIEVWNHYGPTETTICASAAMVPADAEEDPPIGQPIAGACFYLLDEAGNPVPNGVSGELYIGGAAVAAGYLNRPELTAECFLADPFNPGGRMYRTGDMVRRTKTGDLLFVGRRGRQIKFRGFRIELDDIEAALATVPGIDAAAVMATRGADGQLDGLKAVIASRTGWSLPELRRSLGGVLPRHMLPNRLVVLSELPLTPSGKIDRSGLETLEPAAPDRLLQADPWLPPLTETILTMFRTALHQPAMREQDDFFEHGGDSLLALETMMQLEALLGQPVGPQLFAQASNAEGLAGLLLQQQAWGLAAERQRQAILLQRDGTGAPLFCLTDAADRPLAALALAQHFRHERPVWALRPPSGAAGAGGLPAAILEQLATIRSGRPDEPVLLLAEGGAAQAGIEVARQLEARGDAVTLVLVGAPATDAPSSWWMRVRDAFRLRDRGHAAAGPAIRGRTIVVEAASGMVAPARAAAQDRGERIVLPAGRADLMREPAASLLAEALRGRLRPVEGRPARARIAEGAASSGNRA